MKTKLLAFAALFLMPSTFAQKITLIEHGGLRLHVFVPESGIFRPTSVLVEGERELALVDAQFSVDNAQSVVELVRSTGKKLTTIFISYSDPDYYFGLDHIARQFPEAKIRSTAQTAWLIGATYRDKMAIWAPQMGENAPQKIIVPTSIDSDHFMLEDRRIETAGNRQHTFLWIPSARTILGGVYLFDAEHLWVADSQTKADRSAWLAGLDAMEKLHPAYSIPAHFVPGRSDLRGDAPIDFTRRYLTDLEETLVHSRGSAEVIAKMKSLYPALDGESSLEMTARVLTGETAWKTVAVFPPIGRKYKVDFGGDYCFILDFKDDRHMTYTGTSGSLKGVKERVEYTAVEVAPQVYMIYWTEKSNTHVVHVEDYGQGIAYTNIAAPDGSFTNLKGTLQLH